MGSGAVKCKSCELISLCPSTSHEMSVSGKRASVT